MALIAGSAITLRCVEFKKSELQVLDWDFWLFQFRYKRLNSLRRLSGAEFRPSPVLLPPILATRQ